jgi:hypothetical protein
MLRHRHRLTLAVAMAVAACAVEVPAPAVAVASRIRECGDVTANYPRAGVYNVTSRVTRCSRARNIAVRWYFRGQHSALGYRCRKRTMTGSWDVRCTASGGRIVRFQYYVSP